MLCSIDDFQLADGTLSGGFALMGLRLKTTRIADVAIMVPHIQTRGRLYVGAWYKILRYRAGDDFTNVGGTNITGSTFIATAAMPNIWLNDSELIQLSPVVLDRHKRRVDCSFSISRVHESIKASEEYILDHDATIPRTGDAKLIVSVYGITSGTPYALIINGALISHELTAQYGKYTRHAYQIIGAPLFSVIPDTTEHITTESGDRITTETGDTLVIE